MVGVIGFEPTAPCTPCKCASGLRHTPAVQRSVAQPPPLRPLRDVLSNCLGLPPIPSPSTGEG